MIHSQVEGPVPIRNDQLDLETPLGGCDKGFRSIETDSFPTRTGVLCDWCAFQDICPAFANEDGSEV